MFSPSATDDWMDGAAQFVPLHRRFITSHYSERSAINGLFLSEPREVCKFTAAMLSDRQTMKAPSSAG